MVRKSSSDQVALESTSEGSKGTKHKDVQAKGLPEKCGQWVGGGLWSRRRRKEGDPTGAFLVWILLLEEREWYVLTK